MKIVSKLHTRVHMQRLIIQGMFSSYFRKKLPMNEPIDFVVTWVNGNDPEWIADKNRYSQNVEKKGNGSERFRDWNQFFYWYRAVEKYAPWVRKVFLVTYGHVPEWINLKCPKLVFVKHSDYIPEKYLPTFSTVPITLNIHRIKGLSEHFVMFDDDMYLASAVQPSDFFDDGLPKICAISYPLQNWTYNGHFAHQLFGDIGVANGVYNIQTSIENNPELWFSKEYGKDRKYNKRAYLDAYMPGMFYSHLPIPLRKSDMKELWDKIPNILDESSSHKFRTYSDIERFIFTLWEIMTGKFVPVSKTHFGKAFHSLSTQAKEISEAFASKKYKTICLNDSVDVTEENFDRIRNEIEKILSREFPEKSSFEL